MNDKQQLAAMGEHLAEQQKPMCMTKRIEELDKCEPFAWSYEWASCITTDGPQNFKAVIEREAPPQWAVDDGRARKVVPLYTTLHDALVVPEGWQLVPHMPTPEMCAAFHKANDDWEDGWAFDDNGNRHDSPVYQWVAILSAAPSPDDTK